jgi:conjugal transfer pilus assembly protein TraV
MPKKISLTIVAACVLLWLSACAIVNPYDDEFLCPDGYPGDCSSVKEAYKKSLSNNDESFSPMVKNKPPVESNTAGDEEYRYKEELYKELGGLIKQPATPVLIPSKQLRVLIPGYVDNDIYYGHRFVYFTAREARWALQPFDEAEAMEE